MFNDKELGIKHVSFKWTTSTGIMNAIGISYCNKDDVRFEVLKGISTDEKIEDECELASSKEMLANVEVNQKKLFAGTEQGTGKMKKMY